VSLKELIVYTMPVYRVIKRDTKRKISATTIRSILFKVSAIR
jgi:hypothetical protein